MHDFAVVFKYNNTINSPTHNYDTQFVKNIKITLPKLRTFFVKQFRTIFCIKHKIFVHDF